MQPRTQTVRRPASKPLPRNASALHVGALPLSAIHADALYLPDDLETDHRRERERAARRLAEARADAERTRADLAEQRVAELEAPLKRSPEGHHPKPAD